MSGNVWFASVCALLALQLVSSKDMGCEDAIKGSVLESIKGDEFSCTDDNHPAFSYKVGICKNLQDELIPKGGDQQQPGAIQLEVTDNKTTYSLGQVTQTDFMSGTNWAKLEYRGGHNYHSHCGTEGRRTVLFIICDPAHTGELKFIEENKEKDSGSECYYLLELSHSVVCANTEPKSLGPGSIVTIVFFVLLGAYLIIGFLYQRFVVRAVGKEQIPHYPFWQDVGNLAADGCNFVFRSDSSGGSGSREYRGIGDSQLRNTPTADDPPSDTDEHLLPM